jgi:K+-sensing histidine kinase KdpD
MHRLSSGDFTFSISFADGSFGRSFALKTASHENAAGVSLVPNMTPGTLRHLLEKSALSTLLLAAAVAALSYLAPHANLTTVALIFVVIVVATAIWSGSIPALITAVLAAVSLNYFFIPPIHTFVILNRENWIAFATFMLCAITVGQLSSHAQQQRNKAEARRIELERLYSELQNAFEQASQAEALRNSERLKSALLDAVTHDLRTPLTAIKASATALLTSRMDEEGRRDLLEVINEETDRIDRFVEEMMKLAQIEGGQLELLREHVSAVEVINSALERCSNSLRDRHIEVSIPTQLRQIEVDAASIATALFELLDNAATHSPAGTPIVVSAEPADRMVRICVSDRGPGVAANRREEIFKKFVRGPKSAGFGMGLAIARGVVEAHGGKIGVTAAPEGGSVFWFTVPANGD